VPYNVSVVCPEGPINILCSGKPGVVHYNCSQYYKQPTCEILDPSIQGIVCQMTTFSSTNTSCVCSVLTPPQSGTVRIPISSFSSNVRKQFSTSFAEQTEVKIKIQMTVSGLTQEIVESSDSIKMSLRLALAAVLSVPLISIGDPVVVLSPQNSNLELMFHESLLSNSVTISMDVKSPITADNANNLLNSNVNSFISTFVSSAKSKKNKL
jgi:hypothetical protein